MVRLKKTTCVYACVRVWGASTVDLSLSSSSLCFSHCVTPSLSRASLIHRKSKLQATKRRKRKKKKRRTNLVFFHPANTVVNITTRFKMFRGVLTVCRVGTQLPIVVRSRTIPCVARAAPRFFSTAQSEPVPVNNSQSEQAEDPSASLKEVVKKLEDDVKGLKDKVLRAYAEEENVRRIAKRDVESAKEYANTKFAKSLLDVADNLDRALDVVTPQQRQSGDASFKTLVEGLELTRNGLTKVFGEHGITKVRKHNQTSCD